MSAGERPVHPGFGRRAGYTLVELLAVLAVLSVLLMAVWPLAELTAERERERELKRALWEIRDAIDAYKKLADLGALDAVGSGYPPDLHLLVDGVVDRRLGTKVYFLRRIPRDPFADDRLAPEQSWRLRSYESSTTAPQPGADVYDVHSGSDAVALDGSKVAQW